MSVVQAGNAEQIQAAVQAVGEKRPSYAGILSFYAQLFAAQTAAKAKIQLDPIEISADLLKTKTTEKLPLIGLEAFRIDTAVSADTFARICRIATDADADMATSARRLLDHITEDTQLPAAVFSAVLDQDDAALSRMAAATDVSREILAFIGYSSIHASVVLCAEQLAAYLAGSGHHDEGYCPICGSPPVMAVLDAAAERQLVCSFCWQPWSVSRVMCPFCHNRDSQTLDYFYAETEAGYRVDVCHRCRRYIKTLDLRQLSHPIFLPLEQVTTLHFDMMAREKGLHADTVQADRL